MLPVLFKIGNFPVRSWGLLLMAGFLLATWYAARNAPRYKISPENVWDIALVGLFGGVIGARLAWVLQNLPQMVQHPGEIFAVWTGGMTSFGGIIGGILAGLLVARARNVPLWDMADLAGLVFPIGYGIGRIGCFLNGCCYGDVCDLPWAVRFRWEDGIVRLSHPAQLYSTFAALVMFGILFILERRRKFSGQIMLSFIMLYGVYRFLVEFVRAGATAEVSHIAHLTSGQLASVAMVVVGGIWYAIRARRSQTALSTVVYSGAAPTP